MRLKALRNRQDLFQEEVHFFNILTASHWQVFPVSMSTMSSVTHNCCPQGMIALILETIDQCSGFRSMRHLAHLIGEECASKWNDMINYLYFLLGRNFQSFSCPQFLNFSCSGGYCLVVQFRNEWKQYCNMVGILMWCICGHSWLQFCTLTAALIRGNHSNCARFASSKRLDWLVGRLQSQEASKGNTLAHLLCQLLG